MILAEFLPAGIGLTFLSVIADIVSLSCLVNGPQDASTHSAKLGGRWNALLESTHSISAEPVATIESINGFGTSISSR